MSPTTAKKHIAQRVKAYREYDHAYCVDIRPLILARLKPGMKIERVRFRVGSIVRSSYSKGLFAVVGHGYTGEHGNERGAFGCEITDRVFKRWRWIGPEKMLTRAGLAE